MAHKKGAFRRYVLEHLEDFPGYVDEEWEDFRCDRKAWSLRHVESGTCFARRGAWLKIMEILKLDARSKSKPERVSGHKRIRRDEKDETPDETEDETEDDPREEAFKKYIGANFETALNMLSEIRNEVRELKKIIADKDVADS